MQRALGHEEAGACAVRRPHERERESPMCHWGTAGVMRFILESSLWNRVFELGSLHVTFPPTRGLDVLSCLICYLKRIGTPHFPTLKNE